MSEEKIIARRNKLIEWTKTQDIRCTPFCETINENISSINYLLHELQQKENIIKEVREYIEFLKEHYEELRTSPVEDSYFINDMLRQMFIQSIENYLVGIEDILDKGE